MVVRLLRISSSIGIARRVGKEGTGTEAPRLGISAIQVTPRMWLLCRSHLSQCNSHSYSNSSPQRPPTTSSCSSRQLQVLSSRSMSSSGRHRLHPNRCCLLPLLKVKKATSRSTSRRSTTLRRRLRSRARRTSRRTMRVTASKRSKRSAQTRRISRPGTRTQTRTMPWAQSCRRRVFRPVSSAIA